jgi:hypothetical protein
MKTNGSIYVSHYERRITLVVDALQAEWDTAGAGELSDDAARRRRPAYLYALDHIPETVR